MIIQNVYRLTCKKPKHQKWTKIIAGTTWPHEDGSSHISFAQPYVWLSTHMRFPAGFNQDLKPLYTSTFTASCPPDSLKYKNWSFPSSFPPVTPPSWPLRESRLFEFEPGWPSGWGKGGSAVGVFSSTDAATCSCWAGLGSRWCPRWGLLGWPRPMLIPASAPASAPPLTPTPMLGVCSPEGVKCCCWNACCWGLGFHPSWYPV